MGRPLNKKYFGNRNIGTTATTDNGIGGQGILSFGTIVAGSGWTTDPDAYVNDPTLPTGVNATIVAHYKALSMAVTANGTGFNFGDLVEVNTGTATTKARATVSAITAVAAEINAPGDGYAVGDVFVYSTGFASNVTVTVTSISDPDVNGYGPVTGISLTAPGQRTSVAPTNPVSHNNGLGGSGCTVNFTWGVYSLSAPTVAGDYTVFPSTGGAGALVSVPVAGTGLKADVTMGLLSVAVTAGGSGYTSTTVDGLLRFDGGANGASAVTTFTVDTGAPGTLTNQENAIIAYAYVDGGRQVVDILKQQSSRRYKVKGADGTVDSAILVAAQAAAANEMDITAVDSAGKTYYVTKLTAHRALLTPYGAAGHIYPLINGTPQSAPWTFVAAVDQYVQVQNA
jgi:hypothetical protein